MRSFFQRAAALRCTRMSRRRRRNHSLSMRSTSVVDGSFHFENVTQKQQQVTTVMEGACEQQQPGGGDGEVGLPGAMLWSIQEALERQTQQIGASACGATAVVDVLQALGVAVAPEVADRCVQTRLRRTESPLPDYLLSRSEAGATHSQLIAGADQASAGKVTGRFFHLHPRRRVALVPWLAGWIRRGGVPVATMNMQRAVPEGEEVPDAWHHQLIFGAASNAVFMTNPLDVVSEGEVHQRLCSESVLLIRREDVLQRLTPNCSLSSLSDGQSDPRWRTLDVEGQVRRMVLEEENGADVKSTHVMIPAAYRSGVTLFALRDSDVGQQLLSTHDLPLL